MLLYDTTLRDGSQQAGLSFTVADKLLIAERLDRFGVSFIEGGWPGSNPKDAEFFRRVRGRLTQSRLVAFASTRRAGLTAAADPNLEAALRSGVETITLFGKAAPFQVEKIMGISRAEGLDMVGDSIRFLRERGREVFFDAEHFFDGFREDPEYALQVLAVAEEAGAAWVVLCDTTGGTLPQEVPDILRAVRSRVRIPIGIHAHNDAGMADAVSILAVAEGATMVQGTINGYGERCGNANLITILPALELKMRLPVLHREPLSELSRLARFVSEVANLALSPAAPYVGENAFAHKAGVHVGAVRKDSRSYEHVDPAQVGAERRILVSELAGRSNLSYLDQGIDVKGPEAKELLERIKRMEHQGYQFELGEASLRLLLRRHRRATPLYQLESFRVFVERRKDLVCEAVVQVRIGKERVHTAAEGNGPVNALDNAMRKALADRFPGIGRIHLIDYKVRVLDGADGTASRVRVLIESGDGERTWRTIGVSPNIIEASWFALADSLEYGLLLQAEMAEELTMGYPRDQSGKPSDLPPGPES